MNYSYSYYSAIISCLGLVLQTPPVWAAPKTVADLERRFSQTEATPLLPIISHQENGLTSQNNRQETAHSSSSETAETNEESDYKAPPRVVPDENVAPLTTAIFLNAERAVNHLTEWELSSQYLFGNDRSNNLEIDSIAKLDSQVVQSLSQNNLFRSDVQGDYLGIQTVEKERMITTISKEPQTINGFIIQQTFTGNCSAVDPDIADPTQQCSFLPDLVTDRESIDPDLLLPTRFEQASIVESPIAERISQETVDIIEQPGFQNIGADGEPIGLDLFIPNTGGIPGNEQSNETDISREEDIDLTYSGRYYQTRQVIKANDERAVLGRTVQGFGLILDNDNLALNAALQGVGLFLLPDVIPKLEGSKQPVNTNINKNLFVAANNTRLPEDSFTIYQGGIGSSQSPGREDNGEKAPSAHFNSIWLGLSPVVERSLQTATEFEPTSERRVTLRSAEQGGADSNLEFTSIVDGREVSTSTPGLTDFFIQNFTSFLEQDVDFITEQRFVEETNYYPHLSLTGNITGNNRAFRYYGGFIAADEEKWYIGSDYTENFDGWQVNIAGIGYTNPDEEYFSRTAGSIGKVWLFSRNSSLTVSTGFRYVIDRPEEQVLDDPVDNNVNLSATLEMDFFSLTVRRLFDVLPNSAGNQVRANLAVNLGNNTALSAFFRPKRDIESFGATAEYQFIGNRLFKSVSLGWSRSIFDFGEDALGNDLTETNDTFFILLNFSGS